MKILDGLPSTATHGVALTILVIAHHIAQACGLAFVSWSAKGVGAAGLLAPVTTRRPLSATLFLMVSGCLMVGAYERFGPRGFVGNRLLRLGVPVLASALIVIPLRILAFGGHSAEWNNLLDFAYVGNLQHLLLFSLGYALWRWVRRNRPAAETPLSRLAGTVAVLAGASALIGASVAARLCSPITSWLAPMGSLRVTFVDTLQDLGFVVIGAAAFPLAWRTLDALKRIHEIGTREIRTLA